MSSRLPSQFIQSLQNAPGFDEVAFIKAHEETPVTSIRFQPKKYFQFTQHSSVTNLQLPISNPVPWCPQGYYLEERPSFTFDPLFHAGLYYVQEASSQFLYEILKQTTGENTVGKKVLDLCAAPGGKSTLLASYFSDGLVVANEVIKSRASILSENITKWGSGNVVVTNNDPVQFSRLKHFFDVLVADAPCSGSGLFRKDSEAIAEWSEDAVHLCSLRQQRIVADAYDCLRQDGILIYSTCSYSVEEDEAILDWMMSRFQLSAIKIQLKEEWNIVETTSPKYKAYGYRFYPDKVRGEGFFIAAFAKKDGDPFYTTTGQPAPQLFKKEYQLWQPWISEEADLSLVKQNDVVIALPPVLQQHLPLLQKKLYIRQVGTTLGEVKGKDVIPHHALAVSTIGSKDLPAVELTKEQAIQFLQKRDMNFDMSSLQKGWHLALYCELPLGWLKVLPNRLNNYYPAEWRILKN